MLKETTAQLKIAKLRKRIRVVQGGTSSSKTFTIIPMIMQLCIDKKDLECSIVSESIPHLRRGAIRDFIKIMSWVGLLEHKRWNKSTLTYTFQNGSFIEFFSADQPDKMRGARRDVLFINECNNVAFESYNQLAIRTRRIIYLDYNPTSEFWVHKELLGNNDVDFVKLTYKDNEALEPSIVKEIEKAREKGKTDPYWANWWKVYGLGEVGALQGVVFSNWEQVDTIPDGAQLKAYGMDFGFTNDPTAITAIYQFEGQYYLDEVLYRTGMTMSELNDIMKSTMRRDAIIYADSSAALSIRELRTRGWKMKESKKGKDSIDYGINLMQQEKFYVTKKSLNLIKEFRNYIWMTDKAGESMNKPIDAFNHAIDGVRYYFQTKHRKSTPYGI